MNDRILVDHAIVNDVFLAIDGRGVSLTAQDARDLAAELLLYANEVAP